jgi:transcriptional regulator with XRE-family HTH domain
VSGQEFASKLREAREKNGFTLEQVAEAIGVSPERVASWESGEQVPSAMHLDLLATLYAVKSESLFDDGPLQYDDPLKVFTFYEEPNKLFPPKALLEIREWLKFVNDYAEFVSSQGVQPHQLLLVARESDSLTPELVEALMSDPTILAYKGCLPTETGIIVLVFYHPKVGYCYFINACYLGQTPSGLERYPRIALYLVSRAVKEGQLSVSGAAGLLRVDSTTIERELLTKEWYRTSEV